MPKLIIRFLVLILSTLTIWSDADAQSERICADGKRAYFGVCPEGDATRPPGDVPKPQKPQSLISGRYRDNGDGTVTDTQTSRRWMRCALGQTWQGGTCAGETEGYQWELALGAAKDINAQGGYAGYRDWRVPSQEELLGLVYCSSGIWNNAASGCGGDFSIPTIDTTVFPNTPVGYFWADSSVGLFRNAATIVGFGRGVGGHLEKRYHMSVRLVRGGQ